MSAIVEIKVPVERTEEIIRLVWDVEKELDTVVALGVVSLLPGIGQAVNAAALAKDVLDLKAQRTIERLEEAAAKVPE